MEYKEVTLKIPKEACEAIDAAMNLIETIRKCGADGFGPEDISALMTATIQVAAELSDYDEILAEIQGDPQAAVNLASLTGVRLLKALGIGG